MPSPILARADALMQRRRHNTEIDDVPVLTDAVDINAAATDDDVPVLFDIEPIAALGTEPFPELSVIDEGPAVFASEPPEQPLPPIILVAEPSPPAVADIAHEIARRVEARLAVELPRLIEATLRDYLAEQDSNANPSADRR